MAACEGPPPLDKPAAAPPVARTSPARPAAAVRVLRLAPGTLDEVALRGGEERSYLLDLAAGQYAELVVDQQGVDVEVRLRAADGRAVAAVDSFNGILGPEPLPVVAETGGRFRFEIRSITAGAPAGGYALRLDTLRPATRRDRARVEAERLLAEAMRLYHEDTPASLRMSLARGGESLVRFRALGRPEREAEALSCLGKAQDRLGGGGAAGLFQQALALFSGLGDEARVGSTLLELGRLERTSGRPERALALYRQALPLHRRFGNQPEEAATLNNIGRATMDLGETGEALSAFEQALDLWRSLGNQGEEAVTLSNLGNLETTLGQLARALDHLRQAVDLLEALGDRRNLGVALSQLGVARALAADSREKVLDAFERALQLQSATGDRRNQTVTLHNLGWYHHRKGNIRQAERIFRETLAIFRVDRDPAGEAAALVNLGGVDLELGRLPQAAESFTRARALLTKIGNPAEEATALFGLARVRRAEGRPAEALTAIEGAFARVEALRRKADNLELRLTFFASKQDIYELRVSLLMELHRRDPEAGYDARALLASEEARARTLLDLLDEARVETGPRGAELSGTRAMTLREIQRQVVEPGSLLLEYYLGRERSFLWAVTPGTIESFELPPREVLETEARRAAFLLGASRRALARRQTELSLAALSHLLLGPVAPSLHGAERLVIVPDGALWSIPFAALPDPAAGGGSVGEAPPLMVGHEIVTLPSVAVLPRLRAAAAGRCPASGTVAVVADPVFSAADPRVRSRPAVPGQASGPPDGVTPFARLPFSRAEAEAILSVAPPRGTLAALDFAASRETVSSGRLAQYPIVHFATHAVVNTEHPELSGIALSMVDSGGHSRNGFLRLAEIHRLRLSADLVVLSACRTALGQEIRGEGLVGLTRGFFTAGARQVLVSLWRVEDRATAELMRRFYREMLGQNRPAAAALRAAQIAMWRDVGWRPAYYWAGFTLQGDWRVEVNKPIPAEGICSRHTSTQIGG